MSRFVVMDRTAQVPQSWKWKARYRKVALVETDLAEGEPSRIDERDKHVIRIVNLWTPLYQGTTARCEYQQALAEAQRQADELNGEAS